ncbi:MAG: hypothetical protein ACD_22C00100G0027 [uncultured bacterium]|nr:MAG: hypothetical protein ACD_22C00100G0027 [uncultured bacterium]
MLPKDDKIYLEHILDEIDRVEVFLSDWDKEAFLSSDITSDHYALVRSFEIIGEAASKVSSEYKKLHPEIPWRDMIDMRNKISHEYFNIEYNVVWETAKDDLPPLRKSLEHILKN